jgi:hypothetical protein
MSLDYETKPKGDQIRVCLDSGANIHSANVNIVMPQDLGFNSKADWDSATEDEKYKAVVEYFNGDGYPEYSWDDENSVNNTK